jgi:hypothetical protein
MARQLNHASKAGVVALITAILWGVLILAFVLALPLAAHVVLPLTFEAGPLTTEATHALKAL